MATRQRLLSIALLVVAATALDTPEFDEPLDVSLFGKSPEDLAQKVTNFMPDSQEIRGGTPVTDPSKYPWNVDVSNRCGGTHIWPGVVLTGARCVSQGLPRNVWVGAIGQDDGITAVVKEGYFYPNYIDEYPAYNDIALLILDVELASDLFKLERMQLNTKTDYPAPGALMSLVDFGETTVVTRPGPTGDLYYYDDDGHLDRLTGYEVLANAECQLEWKDIGDTERFGSDLLDTDKQMCAFTPGNTGACAEINFNLDNKGAPLYDSNFVQVGLLSIGDCGTVAGRSDVFTRVAPYYPWIFQMICMTAPGNNPPKGCAKMMEPRCGLRKRVHNAVSRAYESARSYLVGGDGQ